VERARYFAIKRGEGEEEAGGLPGSKKGRGGRDQKKIAICIREYSTPNES